MIKIQVRRGPQGVAEFRVTGHAGFADHGQDIVCAAVSALVQTALLGLEKVADQPFAAEVRNGNVQCQLAEGGSDANVKAQAILETMILGLSDIAKEYPRFVRFL